MGQRNGLRRGVVAKWCQAAIGWAAIIWALFGGLAFVARAAEPSAEHPDGLIYTNLVSKSAGGTEQELVAIDPRTGKCETVASNGNGPRVSPDGKSIAFWNSADLGMSAEVFVQKLGGDAQPRQIWKGDGTANLCWTHDGKRVLVNQSIMSNENRSWQHTAWLVDPETGEASSLKLPESEGIVDCAHTSNLLISWSTRNKNRLELFTMRPDGSQATGLTQKGQYDYQGRFSPDDKKIAFMRREKGKLRVCTADADGTHALVALSEQELTNPDQICWSPDAKHLAVGLFDWSLDENGKKIRRAEDDSHVRIAIMELDGADNRELELDREATFIGALDWR